MSWARTRLGALGLAGLGLALLGLGAFAWRSGADRLATDAEREPDSAAIGQLSVGKPLPDLVLLDHEGRALTLGALRGRPVWIAFSRGAYCAYCREQLSALGVRAAEIARAGVQLLAVTPDPPVISARLRTELGLGFPLLSDPGEQAVTALCGGIAHCQLLVDAGGIVRWAGQSESWSEAPAPEALLVLARRLGDEATN